MKSLLYVIKENKKNWYRTYALAKYEILSDIKDSKLGIIWNILNPLIQIFTFWFVFGLGIRNGKPVNGINYFEWMIVGLCVWFFINPSLVKGVKSIHAKSNIITKMKFPISILPVTIVVKELFNHIIMIIIIFIVLISKGIGISIYNLQIIYYIFCAIFFTISVNMVLSVLNMFTRDVSKLVSASMRMLMYITPILWTMDNLPNNIQKIMKLNPIYYIVEGYRNSMLFKTNIFNNLREMIIFWGINIIIFIIGCRLIYKFKYKFIDWI